VLAASLGTGLLLKSLIAVLFPAAAAVIYLGLTHQLFSARTWNRLHPYTGGASCSSSLLPGTSWLLCAIRLFLRGLCTMDRANTTVSLVLLRQRAGAAIPESSLSEGLQYRSASLLLAIPPDMAFPLERLFPRHREAFIQASGSRRTNTIACAVLDRLPAHLLHILNDAGILLDACYPAIALLLGSAMAAGGDWARRGSRALCVISAIAAVAVFAILAHVHGIPTPGDISSALSRNPKAYTLSLGHMEDLTLDSFAYLRLPLLLAGIAFLVGAAEPRVRPGSGRFCPQL